MEEYIYLSLVNGDEELPCDVQPVTLYIGDEEPRETQILMSSVILIQLNSETVLYMF